MPHMNELPLRKVFIAIDGHMKGPDLYAGPIGKRLNSCMELPVIAFMNLDIDEEFRRYLNQNVDLSTDQKYLRDIFVPLNTGNITSSMKTRSPCKLGYARCLTTENHFLHVYISTPDPSSTFISL